MSLSPIVAQREIVASSPESPQSHTRTFAIRLGPEPPLIIQSRCCGAARPAGRSLDLWSSETVEPVFSLRSLGKKYPPQSSEAEARFNFSIFIASFELARIQWVGGII